MQSVLPAQNLWGWFANVSLVVPPGLLFGTGIGLLIGYYWNKLFNSYRKSWLASDVLTIWQAACLWTGQEPSTPIAHKTDPYPLLKILVSAAQAGEIPLHSVAPEGHDYAWSEIKRRDLAEYARKRNLNPAFPF